MMSSTSLFTRPTDRLSWLWLALGAVLLPFTSIQPSLSMAVWLAPIFLIRFARTQRARISLPVIALVSCVAMLLPWHAFFPQFSFLFIVLSLMYGLVSSVSYLLDRLLAPRLSGIARTLVFPLTVTTIDLLLSRFGLLSTWGSPAYTQYGNLPLMQILSITGMWGLTFLISWCAPVVNEVWEHRFAWPTLWRRTGLFAGMLLVVLLFGSVRLAFFPATAPTVRVAGLVPKQALLESIFALPNKTPRTVAERAVARARFTPVVNDLLARTAQEAHAGAKIIFWSEGASFVLTEDEQAVLEQARRLAQREGIYLQLGVMVMLANEHYPFLENRAIMIDPSGAIVWNYAKAHPTPGETGSVAPGPGVVPVVQTPYGRIATIICYDADFPQLVQQAGQKHVDILLDPSLDFDAVATTHDQMATVRAIENGVTLVRATSQGMSSAVDAQGRVLASMDYFTAAPPELVVSVPVQGTFTIYPSLGDSFAYLCIIGLLTLLVVAFIQRRKTKKEPRASEGEAEVSSAPQPSLSRE